MRIVTECADYVQAARARAAVRPNEALWAAVPYGLSREHRGGPARLRGSGRRLEGLRSNRPRGPTAPKRPQTRTPLHFSALLRRSVGHAHTPHAFKQRPGRRRPVPRQPSARVHELPGCRLPRRLARDDPSLDRRRSYQLLSDAGRPAALLARTARQRSPSRFAAAAATNRCIRSARRSADRRARSSPERDAAPARRGRGGGVTPSGQRARPPNFSRRRR